MRVLQVLPTLSAGGAEGFVTNLSVEMQRAGADVRVFLLGGIRGSRGSELLCRLESAGIQVLGKEQRRVGSLRNLLFLSSTIRNWAPDIVQANLPSTEVACAVARVLVPGGRARFVRRLTNTWRSDRPPSWGGRWLDRSYDLTIACAPSVEEAHRTRRSTSARGVVQVIPNGGLLRASAPSASERAAAREALGVPEGVWVVAHIGRMWPLSSNTGLHSAQKAHDVVIKSFAEAFGGDCSAVLLLAGDGPLRPALEALVAECSVEDQVRFLGEVAEPWQTLSAADLFVFPSRHEGLPNVLPEAASCEVPVVASSIPEVRFIAPPEGWLLVPVDDVRGFSDAMREVRCGMERFRAQAARAAVSFRERFSMSSCARRYLAAFEEHRS